MTPDIGPAGRGGARRRTRRRMNQKESTAKQSSQPNVRQDIPQEKDYIDKLEKLGKLHKEGVLNDEEFAAKKKEILDKNI